MKNVYINIEDNPGFLNSFLDYTATILNKSQNTVKEYNYDLNTFLKYILYHFKMTNEKDLKQISIRNMSLETVSKITLDDIHSFLFYLTNTYNSKAATRARKVSSIRVFFNYLCNKAGLIEKNPAQNLETPKLDKRIPKYLTLDDSKKLLEAVNDMDDRNKERDYAIITLFLNCGMRLSELVGINIKDINFNDQKLNVIGKGNKERTIYLNSACMNAVNKYLAVRPHDNVKYDSKDALFLSERRERISNRTVQYIVKQELKRAGLDTNKYSVHKLRHTAATLMYKYGNVDIRALQELLGHESIATTEIYTHVDNSQIRNAVESNPLANIK
ncbi:MAG TPA: tyrosine recombinase XerC [Clostridiaceae bacterium]|nr:tyrosine recombinase XerC [Clostridiaceae bacterium]